jgi:thiosulfate dehydrogenase (quinone) large subunit
MMNSPDASSRAWAILLARAILGLIFFMAGVWKVFQLGPLQHARRYFIEPYAQSFLPRWSLWATGVTVPVVELAAGALLLVGWHVRAALVALGGVLVLVTFGHLLAEPLYEFHTHVIPRAALLFFLLVMPRGDDLMSLDQWLMRRKAREEAPPGDRLRATAGGLERR